MMCSHPFIRVAYKPPWAEKSETLKIIGSLNNGDLKLFQQMDECNKSYPDTKEDWEPTTGKKLKLKYVSYQQIPCGHCMSCRLKYSKTWATRCVLESMSWTENWFITLTYNEEHHKIPEYFEDKNGHTWVNDGSWNGCLKPEDLQKFNKDVREYYRKHYNHIGIRFYACGEYGTKSQRDHFHELMFNFPLKPSQLKYYKTTFDGNVLYTCQELEKIWGKGFVTIGHMNWSTAAYVARYVTKKWTGNTSEIIYGLRGQIPEFCRMSNRPGIGRKYYEEHKEEIYNTDEIIMQKYNMQTITLKPPKYYDSLYDIDYPEDMERIKNARQREAIETQKLKDYTTTLSREEQLELEERDLLTRTKSLIREF